MTDFSMTDTIPEWIVPIKKLVIGDTYKWCKISYPNHPKGCPNYNKKKGCPPHLAPLVKTHFNMEKPLYFVYSEFHLNIHAERMKLKHPEWTERQCKCVLYWQSKSRKQLKERVTQAMWNLKANSWTDCPEGMGVNVYATARLNGLKLERIKNLKICRHVGLLGTRSVFGLGK
jgi:hypothetical protein